MYNVIQSWDDAAKHQMAPLVLVHFGADLLGAAAELVSPTMSTEGELGGECLGSHWPRRPSYRLPRVAFPPLVLALDDWMKKGKRVNSWFEDSPRSS